MELSRRLFLISLGAADFVTHDQRESLGFGRGSRVEGTKSRVEGNMSRVEGAKSRVLRK